MTDAPTSTRTVTSLALPVAAAVGWSVGGATLAMHAAIWCAFGLLNLLAVERLSAATSRAMAAGVTGPAWMWAVKLPLTLALVGLGLRVSDPRAMVIGVLGAVSALLLRSLSSTTER